MPYCAHRPDAVREDQPARSGVSIGDPQLPTWMISQARVGRVERAEVLPVQQVGRTSRASCSRGPSGTGRGSCPPTRRGKSAIPLFLRAGPGQPAHAERA